MATPSPKVANELVPLAVATLAINRKIYGQDGSPSRLADIARTIGALAPLYTYNGDGSAIRRLSDEEMLSGFFLKDGGELHFTDGRAPIADIAVTNSDIQLVTVMLARTLDVEERHSAPESGYPKGATVPTIHMRALRRAAELCGDRELAVRLGVSDRELRLWTEGFAMPPDRIFLEVVDILGEYALQELEGRTASKGDSSL